jgi:hypothetical protein
MAWAIWARGVLHVRHETALEEEVAGRIATHDELGKDDELGPVAHE